MLVSQALLSLPRFSLESLPVILLIILIITLFAVLMWFILSKVPEPIGSWARWIAIVVGGILLLWFLISLMPGSLANAQTTVPTRQIAIDVTRAGVTKQVSVILAADVADRLDSNTQTATDVSAINDAIEITFGHLGEQKANPCDKPASRLINDGRPVVNCSDSVERR